LLRSFKQGSRFGSNDILEQAVFKKDAQLLQFAVERQFPEASIK
jgi:hypothetical protein